MNSQELRSYINRNLGDGIRCLLPSYWWKKLFGSVVDTLDEKVDIANVKTVGGESIIGEGDIHIGLNYVESKSELNKLEAQVGDIVTVSYIGDKYDLNMASVYSANNYSIGIYGALELWDFLTSVSNVEVNENATYNGENFCCYVLFVTKILGKTIRLICLCENGNVFIAFDGFIGSQTIRDDTNGITINYDALNILNKALSSNEFRISFVTEFNYDDGFNGLHQSITEKGEEFFSSVLKIYSRQQTFTNTYVRGSSWEKLSKEIAVSTENDLKKLISEYGSIARVCNNGLQETNLKSLYQLEDSDFNDDGSICFEIASKKASVVKRIDFTMLPGNWADDRYIYFYDHKTNSSILIKFLFIEASDTSIHHSLYYEYVNSEGVTEIDFLWRNEGIAGIFADPKKLERLNRIFSNGEYRYYSRRRLDDANAINATIDSIMMAYVPTSVTSDIYIKGENWEKLSKELSVSSVDKLKKITAPIGTIAKITDVKEIAEGSWGDCYLPPINMSMDNDTFQNILELVSLDVLYNPNKFDRLYGINYTDAISSIPEGFGGVVLSVINPDGKSEDEILPIQFALGYEGGHWYFQKSGDENEIILYTELGEPITEAFQQVNEILNEYKPQILYAIATHLEKSSLIEYLDSAFKPLLKDDNTSDIYIKDDNWVKLLKEDDVNLDRELYLEGVIDLDGGDKLDLGKLTDEQKAYNKQTLILSQQNKASVFVDLSKIFNYDVIARSYVTQCCIQNGYGAYFFNLEEYPVSITMNRDGSVLGIEVIAEFQDSKYMVTTIDSESRNHEYPSAKAVYDFVKQSGGGSSGGSRAYSEVNHGTSDTIFTLTPNTFHVWDEVASLTLDFGSEIAGVVNEYLFQFTSGATATSLTLPDNLKWANDVIPSIKENRTYQISILKGLASVLEFAN